MEPIHYLRALRRRWWVIVAAALVASSAAWFTTKATSRAAPSSTKATAGYAATIVLWNPGAPVVGPGNPITNPATLAQFVRLPNVAAIAAQKMNFQGSPLQLTSRVSAGIDPATGFLAITGAGSDPKTATAVADAFSKGLIAYLGQLQNTQINQEQQLLQEQLEKLITRGAPSTVIASVRNRLAQLSINRTTPIALTEFQRQAARPIPGGDGSTAASSGSGFKMPKSRSLRVLLASVFGLLAGIALALVLERFDTRLRSSRQAEEAFGLPVLAEVPAIARGRRKKVVTASHPYSRAADAFRLVEVGTDRWAFGSGNGHGDGGRPSGAKTLLVTSPEARDGKTTVAANLAVAYAQAGNRVLVVSCDLRRPAIHRVFGVAEQPGLADVLRSANGRSDPIAPLDLAPYLEPCSVVRVAVLPSGSTPERPGELLGSANMQRLVERLKKITDVVILDCAPLVVASDVVPLLPQADGVVLVARARKTRQDLAASTATLLERLGSARAGVVLNDAREFSIPLAKRRMYRPTRKMRKAAKQSPAPPQEEPWVPEPYVPEPQVVEQPSGGVDAPPPVDEPRVIREPDRSVEIPDVTHGGTGPRDEGSAPMRGSASESAAMETAPSARLQMLAPEPVIRIPEALPSESGLAVEAEVEAEVEVQVVETQVEAVSVAEPKRPMPSGDLPLDALQRQLRELRAQLEGFTIDVPRNGSGNGSTNGVAKADSQPGYGAAMEPDPGRSAGRE